MDTLTHFQQLYAINCNDKIEKKNNGSTELSYLSWTYAWAEVKKLFPNANYEILKFGENRLPYVYDEKTGYMVFTKVKIEDVEHEMWLPVMDNSNKAMKDKPYSYKVKEYKKYKWTGNYLDKFVESATMFDINKAIMRCLTKNLAMFGLGLYIYSGEDLPENVEETENKKGTTKKSNISVKNKEVMITDQQKEIIKKIYTQDEIKEYLYDVVEKKKLSDLTLVEASDFIKSKNKEEK